MPGQGANGAGGLGGLPPFSALCWPNMVQAPPPSALWARGGDETSLLARGGGRGRGLGIVKPVAQRFPSRLRSSAAGGLLQGSVCSCLSPVGDAIG